MQIKRSAWLVYNHRIPHKLLLKVWILQFFREVNGRKHASVAHQVLELLLVHFRKLRLLLVMENDQFELGLFSVNQFTECLQSCGKVTRLQHVNEKLTTYHRWLLHATNCFQQHFLSKIRMAENQPAYLIINVIIYLSDSPEDFWESVRLTMIGPLE